MKLKDDEKIGADVVARALEEPARLIAENCGVEGSVVVEKIKEMKGSHGFNARKMEYEDLVASGVLDPAKVARSALQNAASVASLILITEAIVSEKPEEEEEE
jgi:chaperonin GroEL